MTPYFNEYFFILLFFVYLTNFLMFSALLQLHQKEYFHLTPEIEREICATDNSVQSRIRKLKELSEHVLYKHLEDVRTLSIIKKNTNSQVRQTRPCNSCCRSFLVSSIFSGVSKPRNEAASFGVVQR